MCGQRPCFEWELCPVMYNQVTGVTMAQAAQNQQKRQQKQQNQPQNNQNNSGGGFFTGTLNVINTVANAPLSLFSNLFF